MENDLERAGTSQPSLAGSPPRTWAPHSAHLLPTYLPSSAVGHRELAEAVFVSAGVGQAALLQGVRPQEGLQAAAILRNQAIFLEGLLSVCRSRKEKNKTPQSGSLAAAAEKPKESGGITKTVAAAFVADPVI